MGEEVEGPAKKMRPDEFDILFDPDEFLQDSEGTSELFIEKDIGLVEASEIIKRTEEWINEIRFEVRKIWLWVTTSRLDNPNSPFNNRTNVARIIRLSQCWQKSQIDPKWLVGHVLATPNLICQCSWCFQG